MILGLVILAGAWALIAWVGVEITKSPDRK